MQDFKYVFFFSRKGSSRSSWNHKQRTNLVVLPNNEWPHRLFTSILMNRKTFFFFDHTIDSCMILEREQNEDSLA